MVQSSEPLDEFSQIAQRTEGVEQFYQQLLPRLRSRLSAAGTAVWTCDETSIRPFLRFGAADLPAKGKSERHHSLLEKVQHAGQPAYVLPSSSEAPTSNPTNYRLSICPVKVDETVVALLETFHQDADSSDPEGNLRLLRSVARIAGRFHRDTELRRLREQHDWWEGFDLFTQAVHASLNPTETAYAIANEGRRIIQCDRLSVLERRGRKCRVTAVSGQASVNRRANVVVLLQELTAKVLVLGEPFRYPPEDELAPQLEDAVEAYIDVAETSSLLIVPLIRQKPDVTEDSEYDPRTREVIGAIVAEQFSGDPIPGELVRAVARHSSTGLGNALQHRQIFLLPLWSGLGKLLGANLPKTLFVLLLLVAGILALCFVPADFELAAEGTLQPKVRRYVFAESDGVVERLNVKHGQRVLQGDVLAELRNPEIELRLAEIRGELQTTLKKLSATKAARVANSTNPSADRAKLNQVAAEEQELRRWLENLREQQTLLTQRKQSLLVRSPVDGEVTTWDLENLLTARPVSRGDLLMTLVTSDGPWVAELLLADRRAGHLRDAQRNLGQPLEVTYILATNPGEKLQGKVQKVGHTTIVDQQQGLVLPVTIEIDETEIPLLRPGVEVIAKIHCGRAPVGYVWLHEVIEFVQSRILFRF